MNTHNFILAGCDTDSILVCKTDGGSFSKEEQDLFIQELNSLFPKQINWAHDGYFQKVIIFKTKNYVLYNGKKIKLKGNAVKASTKEEALKEFLKTAIQMILDGKEGDLKALYDGYAKEAANVQEIKRWVSRKTLTDKTFSSLRTNESKIADAVKGTEYVIGNRVWVYFRPDQTIALVENFDGNYDKAYLLKKLHATSKLFDTVLPTKELFINYSLKKNQQLLETL